MSINISGYERDVFISYSQKDNKHDGWVTEFVDNLNGESYTKMKIQISCSLKRNVKSVLL
jgi:hypothetical protein